MNVPKLRFKEFNDDWKKDYAGNLCSIQTGKSNTQDKVDDGIYPFYVRSPIIEKSHKYIFDTEAVLTVGDGVGVGKVFHYINGKFDCHQRVYMMNNFNNITAKYFYYIFSRDFDKRVMKMTAKTSVDSVRYEMIDKMQIYYPTVLEQKKISKTLELLDKKIELQSKKIEDLKLFKKGLLNVISKEITESKTIKEICEYKNGNSYEEYICDEGKYNLISLNSVDINGNLKNDMKKIKLSNPDTLIKNDIVMVLSDVAHGDFLGVSALIDEDNKYVLNQRMGLLRIMDNSIPQFIVEMINNEQRKFKILGQGSSQLNLSKDDILNQKIKYPCIISQKKYATIFNNINTGLKLNKEKLIKLQELKKGLMQNMFV